MKKIVVITGSPRAGATEGMADAFQSAAEAKGWGVARFNAARLKVGGCRNCNACGRVAGRTCVFDDDFTAVSAAVLGADGLVLATPLYWYSWPWQVKATLDRFYSFLVGGFDLSGKKAALIASCGEPDAAAMDGLVFSFRKTTALLGLEDVGHVLVPGLHAPDEYKATDACARAAALADRF
ncbi:MAG: flavodoxin family protein [Kiritimatiellae bacterium]|nr:flavodoxin family protein [Kiritimatiellia bacterium]